MKLYNFFSGAPSKSDFPRVLVNHQQLHFLVLKEEVPKSHVRLCVKWLRTCLSSDVVEEISFGYFSQRNLFSFINYTFQVTDLENITSLVASKRALRWVRKSVSKKETYIYVRYICSNIDDVGHNEWYFLFVLLHECWLLEKTYFRVDFFNKMTLPYSPQYF